MTIAGYFLNWAMSDKKHRADSVNEPASEGYQLSERSRIFQFLELAKELSPSSIKEIVERLSGMLKQSPENSKSEFSAFLLSGPQMSDSQFEEYKKQRENLNQWRLK